MQITRARPEALVGFLCLMPFAIGAILLAAFVTGDTANFNTAVVFFMILIFSLSFALLAQQFNHGIKWFDAPQKSDWKWILVGYGGMLLATFIVPSIIPGNLGIVVGIGVGGIGLAYALYKSESLFIPWLSHAAYNITAIALASASIVPIAKSVFYVPTFSFSNITPQDFLSQALLQLFAVSAAEESLKVCFAIGIALLFTKNKKVAFGAAIVAWSLLHVVLAYPLHI